MMTPNVLEDCTPLYVRRLSLYYLTSAMIVTTDNRTMIITQVTFVVIYIKNNGAYMNADNYKISTLPYIENASNERIVIDFISGMTDEFFLNQVTFYKNN